MGWEGIHLFTFNLRGRHYGSVELGVGSPKISLEELQLRKGQRFGYEYDLNIPWVHEIRFEGRLPAKSGRTYPCCQAGAAACPPEDCRGPVEFLARRGSRLSDGGIDDLGSLAEFLDEVVLKERRELLEDGALLDEMRTTLARLDARRAWEGKPFERKAVNTRLAKGEHLALMHQQF